MFRSIVHVNKRFTESVIRFAVLLGVAALISFFMQVNTFEAAGASLTRRLRAQVFHALMRQEVGFFDEEGHSLGALTSRLATDAAAVCDMVTKTWGDIVQLFVTAIAGLTIGFVHAWHLTLVCSCRLRRRHQWSFANDFCLRSDRPYHVAVHGSRFLVRV